EKCSLTIVIPSVARNLLLIWHKIPRLKHELLYQKLMLSLGMTKLSDKLRDSFFATGQPRHHATKLFADFFDRMLFFFLAQRVEVGAAFFILFNPLAGKFAALDLAQRFFHRLTSGIADDALTACQVAIFSSVGDRITHASESAFVDQVHDQLHFVQAFEVGDLRSVPGLDQRFESFLDERSETAAKNGLLAEQIAFRLFSEGSLQNTCAGCTDAICK